MEKPFDAGQNEFAWIGLSSPTGRELEALKAMFGLHPLAVEDALAGKQGPPPISNSVKASSRDNLLCSIQVLLVGPHGCRSLTRVSRPFPGLPLTSAVKRS